MTGVKVVRDREPRKHKLVAILQARGGRGMEFREVRAASGWDLPLCQSELAKLKNYGIVEYRDGKWFARIQVTPPKRKLREIEDD